MPRALHVRSRGRAPAIPPEGFPPADLQGFRADPFLCPEGAGCALGHEAARRAGASVPGPAGPDVACRVRLLGRTIFRIAAGELRQRGRRGPEPIESVYEMTDLARDLVAALARLSQKQRAAVVLHHVAGYPAKQIAEIIGGTAPSVHVHLSRARKRLR